MKFLSLFSGYGGFDLGLERAGMECVGQVEIDKNCNRVLERHWPDRSRWGDIREFIATDIVRRPDWIVGGFPCQDLSVAGQRAGLSGERSGLWREFRRLIGEFSPSGVLIENVPGLLSGCGCPLCCEVSRRTARHISDERKCNPMARDCGCRECRIGERLHRAHSGRNLSIILSGLEELGYGVSWRVLDAQFWGVPQRRRRVFIVGCLGDWRRAAQILFESDCLPWDSAPRREAGERVAPKIASGANGGGASGPGRDVDTADSLIPIQEVGKGTTCCGAGPHGSGIGNAGDPMYTLQAGAQHAIAFDTTQITSPGNYSQPKSGDPCHPLAAGMHAPAVAFQARIARNGRGQPSEVVSALTSSEGGTHADSKPHVAGSFGVRRLTPRECERLMGLPDDWTRYDATGKELSDSARYRMIGNGVVVPVIEWLGRRILAAERSE